ncbi:MAG: methylmalonyl-CoA mutase [Thaumarchaeota archaeon]|nr:methylmalonyl-CoA mutase [Nitrososphaerota archaeon]
MSNRKFHTDSRIPVKNTYEPRDLKNFSYNKDLGDPGQFPFTRGVYPTMYREHLWTMRQYTGFGSAEETNKRFKYLLSQGQTGLSTAFDLPTQLGYDSDSKRAHGEVGKVGVPICTLADMEILLQDIPLNKVSTSMTINATAPILLAMYIAVAEKQGVKQDQIRGTTQNDILKEFAARNLYIYPPKHSLRLVVDVIEYCVKNLSRWHPISISGYHIREAGADAVQEVAYALSNAQQYVDACLERGLKINDIAPSLSFFFACRNDFFEEVAKFRVARRLWARIVKDEYGGSEESCKMKFHVQTSGETLTAQQPDVNVIRVTLQALAAVLGGAQSLHTNSRDEALGLPTEESVKIALRTQQTIAYESGVTKVTDPMGGSFYLEALTNEVENKIGQEMKRVRKMGGAMIAIENGYMQGAIRDSAYKLQARIESGEETVIGVNRFIEEGKPNVNIHRIPQTAVEQQLKRIRRVKGTRDKTQVNGAIQRLQRSAKTGDNVMPAIIGAVKSYATLQEISDVLRKVFGEQSKSAMI